MSHQILLGNSLWRDLFWPSLPMAEKILRALTIYLFLAPLLGRLRQARIRATESVQSGRAVDALEHSAECDYRRGQLDHGRLDRRGRAAGR
jgi:hypothetical protein